ncbi:hypothetical protein KIN20_014121 [Parelaphostrongylus tenuis]|uniref:Uncharacterized protein n=1 Tax=Parelaphostrongylus tenuis TaxID=148309 RepID=A0AAD5QRL8_PARTN|nr:hypothetical protein KIN20_014121 [Parelaphostrongylus tenuis]
MSPLQNRQTIVWEQQAVASYDEVDFRKEIDLNMMTNYSTEKYEKRKKRCKWRVMFDFATALSV